MATTTTSAGRWWLLSTRGIIYVLIGVVMFIFSTRYSAQSASIIGILAILAGGCGLIYALTNDRSDRNNIWGVLHGITDIVFGIAMFAYSDGTIKGFVDVLGFWAIMYAFLQSVQAMYLFMASSGSGSMSSNYPFKFVHFANVFVAGLLAFNLLLRPQGFVDSLGIVGIFPIILGGLIIFLSAQFKARSGR
jgi:uncharacterized membrane protein HdeD (DUF308 family)